MLRPLQRYFPHLKQVFSVLVKILLKPTFFPSAVGSVHMQVMHFQMGFVAHVCIRGCMDKNKVK